MQKTNSATLRLKDSLSYRLGQAMIAYDKNGGGGLCDKDFKSTNSAKQNLSSTTSLNQNSNSTTSALTSKTKQNFSRLTNKRFSLKNFILLLFKLYEIKRSHKRTQRLYKDYIFLYPHLKYEKLELCPDYKEALKLKFHLSFLLGQALINASKTWYKGGFFKLYSLIKEANKTFREFKEYENEVDSFVLALIFENQAQILLKDKNLKEALIDLLNSLNLNQKEAFVRNLLKFVEGLDSTLNLNSSSNLNQALNSNSNLNKTLNSNSSKQNLNSSLNPIQQAFQNESFRKDLGLFLKDFLDLLKTFKDYEALNESLKHNLSFNFTFLYENLSLIKTWLSSSEFKEKFQNHPYPSLLNPEKIEYESINAELAWDLNLPLPPFYDLLLLRGHGSGGVAMCAFLRNCGVSTLSGFYPWFPNTKYYGIYEKLLDNPNGYNVLVYAEWGNDDYPNAWSANNGYDRNKLYALTNKKVPVLFQVRDPIAQIKHGWGRIWTGMKKTWKNTFYLGEDILEKIPIIQPKKEVIFSRNLEEVKVFKWHVFIRKKLYNTFKTSGEVTFLDISELSKEKAFDTVTKLSHKYKFNQPKEEDRKIVFETLQTGGRAMAFLFPLILLARAKDINVGDEKVSITIGQTPKHYCGFEEDQINITNEILDYTPKEFAFVIKKSEYEIFKKNSKFFEAIKQNLRDFAHKLEKRIELEESLMLKEKDVLEYLRANKKTREELKEILDDDLSFVKELRPDIVASWKYYAEFEKMCTELDGKKTETNKG